MDYSKLRLPWKQLERGQGFFIPCLDFEEVRKRVLMKAVGERVLDGRGIPGILNGKAGVLFFRGFLATARKPDPPAPSQSPPA